MVPALVYSGHKSKILEFALQKIGALSLLAPDGIIIAEHRKNQAYTCPAELLLSRQIPYGEATLSFFI